MHLDLGVGRNFALAAAAMSHPFALGTSPAHSARGRAISHSREACRRDRAKTGALSPSVKGIEREWVALAVQNQNLEPVSGEKPLPPKPRSGASDFWGDIMQLGVRAVEKPAQIARRLSDALLVFDQREAQKTLAMLAEADAGSNCEISLFDQ